MPIAHGRMPAAPRSAGTSVVPGLVARLEELMDVAASLGNPERHALATTLRSYAARLDDGDADAAVTSSMRKLSIAESAPWQLDQPHCEAMPWKLLLSRWSLLGPFDQVRLRGVCSGLCVGDLSSFLLTQCPSVKYTHLDEYFCVEESGREVGSVDGRTALVMANKAYVELCFVRDLQTRCAAAEARELAVAEEVQGIVPARSRSYDERVSALKIVRKTLLPGDPRISKAARRLAGLTGPGCCAATVAGSFALHRLLAVQQPRHALAWKPDDMDVFVQSHAAYEEALVCIRELVVSLGGVGYHVARGTDAYGWPMNFDGESFDPDEREDGEYRDLPVPYGFASMAPFTKRMVHEIAAGRPLEHRFSNYSIRPERKRRPKPLREWLDRTLPAQAGRPRSYGLYASSLIEIVDHHAHPICSTPPKKALKIGSWMGQRATEEFIPLLRVNVIQIGARTAYDALGDNERFMAGMSPSGPAWGSAERILPARIAAEFDMHTCAVAMLVNDDLTPVFLHSDEALRCATGGHIALTPFAFCSEDADRTNAIHKVLERIEKYMARGFELHGQPQARPRHRSPTPPASQPVPDEPPFPESGPAPPFSGGE